MERLMTEAEYRALTIDSYSTLKEFVEDRKYYYKKYVLREPVEDKSTPFTIFGSLVDCLLFSKDEYDSRYCLAVTQVPTGQYAKLVDKLMEVTLRAVNDIGEVTKDVEILLEEAYNEVKFDRNGNIVDFKRDSLDVVKKKFVGTELEIYYKQLRETYGKTVIEQSTLDNAHKVVNDLRTCHFTEEIINAENTKDITVYNQFPIIGEMNGALTKSAGLPLKCLVDKLIIKHAAKEIHIYDLKTTYDNEQEFMANYLKYKYYIQNGVYYYLVTEWKKKIKAIEDYQVFYPVFIVAESSAYKWPLLYQADTENFQQSMRGFTRNGREYAGVLKIIKDLIWHKETGIWNTSRDAYDNKGIIQVPTFL